MSKKKLEVEQDKTPIVLVVDDNQENLELLQAYLEDINCETIAAHDGPKALEIISRGAPDLILLDVMMPKMSGFEVCKRVKNDPRTTDIPVIMVTTSDDHQIAEKCYSLGCEAHLVKPISESLVKIIERVGGHL